MNCDCGYISNDFARLSAETGSFRKGAPRSFSISEAGDRLAYVRSSGSHDSVLDLWLVEHLDGTPHERLLVTAGSLLADDETLSPAERARRERLRESGAGITSFSHDQQLSTIVFALSGQLFSCDVASGNVGRIGDYSAVVDPRLNSRGDAVAFTDGADFVVYSLPTAAEMLRLSAGSEHVTYGLADFIAAEELERFRGHWWAPDGDRLLVQRNDESAVAVRWLADPTYPAAEPRAHRYPQAGTANSVVGLIAIDLSDGSQQEIEWDRARFEYLVSVDWSDQRPLIKLSSRDQRRMTAFELEAGELRQVADFADDCWIDAGSGLPVRRGKSLWSERITDAARVITCNEHPLDLSDQHVEVVHAADEASVIAAVYAQPWQRQIVRVHRDGGHDLLSDPDGYALCAAADGCYAVIVQHGLDRALPEYRLLRDGKQIATINSHAARPPVEVRVTVESVTADQLPTAVLWPTGHRLGSHRLPVVVSIYGGPHHSEVIASAWSYAADQWLADQGFCVLVIDNRGTPGKGPAWEREVVGNLADPVLEDQVAALQALIARYPDDIDPARVGITGWSFGGYLTALAVLDRPDVYAAGWAGAPVTDWTLYDTAYTERYLGHPAEQPEQYRQSSLLHRAEQLQRPLAIVHGLADDNVLAANSLQLSAALLVAGRPHRFLPLAGVSHMTPQVEISQNLMLLTRDFFLETLA